MLTAEVQHFLGLSNIANHRTSKALTPHNQTESYDGQMGAQERQQAPANRLHEASSNNY